MMSPLAMSTIVLVCLSVLPVVSSYQDKLKVARLPYDSRVPARTTYDEEYENAGTLIVHFNDILDLTGVNVYDFANDAGTVLVQNYANDKSNCIELIDGVPKFPQCDGSNENQLMKLIPAEAGGAVAITFSSGHCLGGTHDENYKLVATPGDPYCGDSEAYHWGLLYRKGFLYFVNIESGFCANIPMDQDTLNSHICNYGNDMNIWRICSPADPTKCWPDS